MNEVSSHWKDLFTKKFSIKSTYKITRLSKYVRDFSARFYRKSYFTDVLTYFIAIFRVNIIELYAYTLYEYPGEGNKICLNAGEKLINSITIFSHAVNVQSLTIIPHYS